MVFLSSHRCVDCIDLWLSKGMLDTLGHLSASAWILPFLALSRPPLRDTPSSTAGPTQIPNLTSTHTHTHTDRHTQTHTHTHTYTHTDMLPYTYVAKHSGEEQSHNHWKPRTTKYWGENTHTHKLVETDAALKQGPTGDTHTHAHTHARLSLIAPAGPCLASTAVCMAPVSEPLAATVQPRWRAWLQPEAAWSSLVLEPESASPSNCAS